MSLQGRRLLSCINWEYVLFFRYTQQKWRNKSKIEKWTGDVSFAAWYTWKKLKDFLPQIHPQYYCFNGSHRLAKIDQQGSWVYLISNFSAFKFSPNKRFKIYVVTFVYSDVYRNSRSRRSYLTSPYGGVYHQLFVKWFVHGYSWPLSSNHSLAQPLSMSMILSHNSMV